LAAAAGAAAAEEEAAAGVEGEGEEGVEKARVGRKWWVLDNEDCLLALHALMQL
jgi:hypothetical protein